MTQGTTIQPGATNAPNMGNFGGAMNMSNVPNNPIDPMTGLPMNQATMAQMKVERKPTVKGPDLTDSTAAFMGGPNWQNPHWKEASDSVRVHYPDIDFDEVKSSDIYNKSKGDQLHNVTSHLKKANKRYNITPSKIVKGWNY